MSRARITAKSFLALLVAASAGQLLAQPPNRPSIPVPSVFEMIEMLQREPIVLKSWPEWRSRLLAWLEDRGAATTPAYEAAWAFLKKEAGASAELPPALANDAFAWYLLGSAYMFDKTEGGTLSNAVRGEKALRRSLQLKPDFARSHARLASLLIWRQQMSRQPGAPPLPVAEAERELAEARKLEPNCSLLKPIQAQLAQAQDRYADAARLFEEALAEAPEQASLAQGAANAIVANKDRDARRAPRVKALVERFPDDGMLACFHGVALAQDGEFRAGMKELQRARQLGTDPEAFLGKENVRVMEEAATPGWIEQFAWVMLYFAGLYGVVMLLMAGAGVLLASRTRGSRALQLLGAEPDQLVSAGQVTRTEQESTLAHLYAYALVAGLILFYAAIPFIIAGLLGITGLLLLLVINLGRIPIKLLIIIVIVGGGAVWAVLKGLFTRPPEGSFGLRKSAAECPRLHQVLTEVARRVDTEPVSEVYIAPGSSIGVHQEGRGPFGIFGVRRRVLTLGMSTMHFLTVGELQAILAHEYAHFSHRDTYYSRFIYQVTMSIQQALAGMGASGGIFNYVNPFYWFLFLYYKAYTLLAAGFSRSREFLADRMASCLYGSDVFASALAKVCTDGTLFEMTIYGNINSLLEQNQAFINMYAAFRSFRDEQLSVQARDEMYQKLLEETGSLFASHPTFGERIEAVATLPRAERTDPMRALDLFDNPEELEKDLTEFLTGYMNYVRAVQAQAASQQ